MTEHILLPQFIRALFHIRPGRNGDRTEISGFPDKVVDITVAIDKIDKIGIEAVKAEGDTIGGIITGVIQGCPPGLGEPVFGKLHAALGAAMLGINAVKGFEYGEGFSGVAARGSEQNDIFVPDGKGGITTATNHSGGIQGGISNGQDILFRVAFKPVATLLKAQPTVDVAGHAVEVTARGRHDPCVLPRAVPVVEAMAAMTILDYYLFERSRNVKK